MTGGSARIICHTQTGAGIAERSTILYLAAASIAPNNKHKDEG